MYEGFACIFSFFPSARVISFFYTNLNNGFCSTYWIMDFICTFVPRIERHHERLQVLPVPETDVGKQCANRQIRKYETESKSAGQIGRLQEMD